MRAERKQKNDRNGNADQPKQHGAHNVRLLLARSMGNNGAAVKLFP
jgi:hypothetical protein